MASSEVVLTEMDRAYLKKAYRKKARGEKYNYLQFLVEQLLEKEKLERRKEQSLRKRKVRAGEEEEEDEGFVGQPKLPRLEMFLQREKEGILEVPRLGSCRSKTKNPRFSEGFIYDQEEFTVASEDEWRLDDEEPKMKKKKKTNKNKKNKKKVKKSKGVPNNRIIRPPPAEPTTFPVQLMQKIEEVGGTKPVWLTEKVLTDSDVKDHLQRFFIPRCEKLVGLITKEERCVLDDENRSGVPVLVVDHMGAEWNLDFRFWDSVGKYGTYVLTHGWNQVVIGLRLIKDRSKLQLWSFRQPENGNSLCFAINVVYW